MRWVPWKQSRAQGTLVAANSIESHLSVRSDPGAGQSTQILPTRQRPVEGGLSDAPSGM